MSFGEIMRNNRGLGPGFDFLRLALALSVVLFHSFQLSYGYTWQSGPFAAVISLIVPAFFALSGFLVAGSMVRVKLVRTFLLFRLLRILPALAVEITLSALILGPIVTSLPLREYFSDPQLSSYFANVVGFIHYRLPGVFLGNPVTGIVNGQLWTIPSELHCYVMLAVLMLLRVATRPRVTLAIFLAGAGLETVFAFLPGHVGDRRLFSSQELLILCFLCGNIFFLWRDHVPARWYLFVASAAVYVLLYNFAPVLSLLLGVVCATYFITFLGMQRMPRIPLLMGGDYSYGIYLYSFSLQQTVAWALPDHREWWVNLALGGPAAILIAMFSWHVVEKPALGLRKLFAPKVLNPRPLTEPA